MSSKVSLLEKYHPKAIEDIVGNKNQIKSFEGWLKDGALVAVHDAHPRYGIDSVVDDVQRIFLDNGNWSNMEHVKSIISGVYGKNGSSVEPNDCK